MTPPWAISTGRMAPAAAPPGAMALLRRCARPGCARDRQPHDRGAAGTAFRGAVPATVLERERAAVSLGDLARERETDARTRGLRGEERHEQVRGVDHARALVEHAQLEHVVGHRPLEPDAAMG